MAASASNESSVAPRAAILLPVALLLHQAEEWFGGFSAWTRVALGNEVTPERFILINTIGFAVFAIGTLAALRSPRMAWFGATFAALLGLNGVVHALATFGLGSYSPGTVTGLLLNVPLSVVLLRALKARLSCDVFAGSVFFGVVIHGIASLLAFL